MLPYHENLSLLNHATTDLGITMEDLAKVLDHYVNDDLAPAWGVQCAVSLTESLSGIKLIIVDDPYQAGTLGFHEQSEDGRPVGYVSVREALRNNERITTVGTHELAEMLVDPSCSRGVMSPRGRWCALEICDPVERLTYFGFGGQIVSNFVTPAWFGQGVKGPWDHNGSCSFPWQILSGGYLPVFEGGEWKNLFGSREAELAFKQEERRLHRTERRMKSLRQSWHHERGLTMHNGKPVVLI